MYVAPQTPRDSALWPMEATSRSEACPRRLRLPICCHQEITIMKVEPSGRTTHGQTLPRREE